MVIAPVSWDIMEEIQCDHQHEPPPPQCPQNKQYAPVTAMGPYNCNLLQWVHTSLSAGHQGISRTLHLIQNSFWWPAMNKNITDYVKSCQVCT